METGPRVFAFERGTDPVLELEQPLPDLVGGAAQIAPSAAAIVTDPPEVWT